MYLYVEEMKTKTAPNGYTQDSSKIHTNTAVYIHTIHMIHTFTYINSVLYIALIISNYIFYRDTT